GPLKEPAGHGGAHDHGSAHDHGTGHDHGGGRGLGGGRGHVLSNSRGAQTEKHSGHGDSELPTDLSAREIGILVPLAIVCLAIGIYPKPMLEAIAPSVERTLVAYPKLVEQYARDGSLINPAPAKDSAVALAQPALVK
ncbi:MAG: hypothetical protein WCI96_11665, partial [Planctomycetota bacterium]